MQPSRIFLIAGGGRPVDYAYTSIGQGKDEDLGVMQPTTLIPTGEITTASQMIRFAGTSDKVGDTIGMCVAPGFACGLRPTIPPRYRVNPACVIVRERWSFIDAANRRVQGSGAPRLRFLHSDVE
jgi:hypothetical protein